MGTGFSFIILSLSYADVNYPRVHDESIKKGLTIVVYGPGEE